MPRWFALAVLLVALAGCVPAAQRRPADAYPDPPAVVMQAATRALQALPGYTITGTTRLPAGGGILRAENGALWIEINVTPDQGSTLVQVAGDAGWLRQEGAGFDDLNAADVQRVRAAIRAELGP